MLKEQLDRQAESVMGLAPHVVHFVPFICFFLPNNYLGFYFSPRRKVGGFPVASLKAFHSKMGGEFTYPKMGSHWC